MEIEHIRCPLNKYTFKVKKIKEWVERNCKGKVLNLYAGYTLLNVDETRNDLDPTTPSDYYLDALSCVQQWDTPMFDTIILDPPYAERKSMEMYGGRKASSFMMVKEHIPKILKPNGRVITLGYHSVSMGTKRGFEVEAIALFSHGGAIHDTIGTVERYCNLF